MRLKEIIINFLISFISIFLGMLCTFAGQGMIDRAADKKEVRSALALVRSELVTNKSDISTMSEYLRQERRAAEYFLENRTKLASCPQDSINFHSGVIFADASITLSQDALELLKMSSLFQKIGDNDTAMKIIRAYDTCSSAAASLNRRIESRNAMFEASVNEQTARKLASTGSIDIKEFIKTNYGLYAIRWLSQQPGPEYYADVSDLDEAIAAIDSYLQGRRIKPRK